MTDLEREILDFLAIIRQYAPKIYAHIIGQIKALAGHLRAAGN